MRTRYWILLSFTLGVALIGNLLRETERPLQEQLSFLEYCEQQKLECTESIEYGDSYMAHSREVRFTSWKYQSDDGITNISLGHSLHMTKTPEGKVTYYALPTLNWSWDVGRSIALDRAKERQRLLPAK